MAETRRGAVMLLTSGDPAIYNAIADGILTARALTPSQPETPEAAMIRKRAADALRRIDMRCRPKEADDDDIETRILKAQATYGTVSRPSVLRTIGGKLLGLYGFAVLRVHDFLDFDNARWRG